MSCNLFVFIIVFSFSLVCVEGINCYSNHTRSTTTNGGHEYCIYAQTDDGTVYLMCSDDMHYIQTLPRYPESEMGECVKVPGYLKFMKCNSDNCNTVCEVSGYTTTTETEVTTEQTSTTSLASTTFVPKDAAKPNQSSTVSNNNVTKAETTYISVGATTIQKPIGKASTATSAASSQTTATCSTDSTSDIRKPDRTDEQNGGVQGAANAETFGPGQLGNKPLGRPNNCDCRCDHKKEQNTFIVVNGVASFNVMMATLSTIIVFFF
uniref:Chitin-binding type-2 domain-containing protein n=1 Tax=Panagrellus redivivus TaxID=6233 RepID=A0A7E4V9B8_PANRE